MSLWVDRFPNLHSFKWFSDGKGSPGVNDDSISWTFACTITYNINIGNQTTRNTAFRLQFKVKCCSHHKSERETVKIKVITLQYDTVFVLISKSLHTLNSHYDNIQMLHDVECHHQKYTVSHKKWQSLYTTVTMDNLNRFLPRCMKCRRGVAMRILSVRLSVCPSVCHTRVLWQNGRKICPDFYTIRKNI